MSDGSYAVVMPLEDDKESNSDVQPMVPEADADIEDGEPQRQDFMAVDDDAEEDDKHRLPKMEGFCSEQLFMRRRLMTSCL